MLPLLSGRQMAYAGIISQTNAYCVSGQHQGINLTFFLVLPWILSEVNTLDILFVSMYFLWYLCGQGVVLCLKKLLQPWPKMTSIYHSDSNPGGGSCYKHFYDPSKWNIQRNLRKYEKVFILYPNMIYVKSCASAFYLQYRYNKLWHFGT